MGLEYFGGPRILNGLTEATQTFAVGSSGTDFGIASSGSAHTFNIPDASASARGLVTTGTQTFAGAKTFSTSMSSPTLTLTTDSGSLPGLNFTYAANGGIIQNNGTRAFLFNGGGITVTQNMYVDNNIALTINGYMTGSSNVISVRGGTAAQTFRIYNTYTSSTNFEMLQIKAVSSAAYQIGSAIGSAGGTTRALDIGRWDSTGTWSSSLLIDPANFLVTVPSTQILLVTALMLTSNGQIRGTSGNITLSDHASGTNFNLLRFGGTSSSYPAIKRSSTTLSLRLADDSADAALICGAITASSTIQVSIPSSGVAFSASATSGYAIVEVGGSSTGGYFRLLAASVAKWAINNATTAADVDFYSYTASANVLTLKGSTKEAVFYGQLTHVPPATVTLSTNGQFSVEMTSDTAGNLVYRGSDGTTRRCALVFV